MRAAVDTLVRRIDAHARVRFPASSASNELRAHVIAFSGGVDSSLAAALVHQAFPRSAAACLGVSPSLSRQQLSQARAVAAQLQLPLWECATAEGANADYVANRGESCYHCKTTLYETIGRVATFAAEKVNADATAPAVKPIIYNGTNADDQLDPTRLGLVAAAEFDVFSPLSQLTKRQVREVAKYLGLPNWNAAASPCLRSRLEFGVEAVESHLKRVEDAEDFVRRVLRLQPEHNMRVRFLAGNRAAVELEAGALETAAALRDAIAQELRRLGFESVKLRAFRSGSLSGYTPPVEPTHHSAHE